MSTIAYRIIKPISLYKTWAVIPVDYSDENQLKLPDTFTIEYLLSEWYIREYVNKDPEIWDKVYTQWSDTIWEVIAVTERWAIVHYEDLPDEVFFFNPLSDIIY